MVEGLAKAYSLGFADCKTHITQLFSKIGLSKNRVIEEAEEEPRTTSIEPEVAPKVPIKLVAPTTPEA